VTTPAAATGDFPHLHAEGVERRFGAARVLRGVDLTVRAGELHVIAGPNGAGKTTLLRILAGLSRPSQGRVRVFGHSLRDHPSHRRELGLLSHQSLLYDDLSPRENLVFAGRLYGLAAPGPAAEAALEQVGLAHRMHDPVRRLSRGMVQRVAIARALLHGPRVLLLDEPFTGLDAPSAARVVEVLRAQLVAGGALVLVTHNLAEVWSLATSISVLVRGRWVIDEPRPADREAFMERLHGALGD
jgi:heme ABC exporter ATP-binding subunit CcmA